MLFVKLGLFPACQFPILGVNLTGLGVRSNVPLQFGIVQLQIKELDECAKLLRYTSNNVNQIARRVNSGGGVYPDEVDEITAKLTEASGLFGSILEQLSKIK